MRDGGKGDTPRPLCVPLKQFDSNWDVIFRNKKLVEEAPYNPGYEDASFAPGSFKDVDTPKPALWINTNTLLHGNGGDTFWDTEVSWCAEDGFSPLYAQPVNKILTDEEIVEAYKKIHGWDVKLGDKNWIGLARELLRKVQQQ